MIELSFFAIISAFSLCIINSARKLCYYDCHPLDGTTVSWISCVQSPVRSTWKWMLGIQSFPFGCIANFRGLYLLVFFFGGGGGGVNIKTVQLQKCFTPFSPTKCPTSRNFLMNTEFLKLPNSWSSENPTNFSRQKHPSKVLHVPRSLKDLALLLQEAVMERGLDGARNPSSALLAKIKEINGKRWDLMARKNLHVGWLVGIVGWLVGWLVGRLVGIVCVWLVVIFGFVAVGGGDGWPRWSTGLSKVEEYNWTTPTEFWIHRENGGTLGMVPLIINPYTPYVVGIGYLAFSLWSIYQHCHRVIEHQSMWFNRMEKLFLQRNPGWWMYFPDNILYINGWIIQYIYIVYIWWLHMKGHMITISHPKSLYVESKDF